MRAAFQPCSPPSPMALDRLDRAEEPNLAWTHLAEPGLMPQTSQEHFPSRFLWRQWKPCANRETRSEAVQWPSSLHLLSAVNYKHHIQEPSSKKNKSSQTNPAINFQSMNLNKSIDLYQYNLFVTDQNRNKSLRSSLHYITKSETSQVLVKMILHINTAQNLLYFAVSPGGPKLCSIKVPTAHAELSLLEPGSLASLTGKPFKWNYTGFTERGGKGQNLCAAMPCLTCANL